MTTKNVRKNINQKAKVLEKKTSAAKTAAKPSETLKNAGKMEEKRLKKTGKAEKKARKIEDLLNKSLCKIIKKKYQKNDFKKYAELVNKPAFVCEKCGRAANDKKNLCYPKALIKGL